MDPDWKRIYPCYAVLHRGWKSAYVKQSSQQTQSINQSIEQSFDWPINTQSINQSTTGSHTRGVCQFSYNQAIKRLITYWSYRFELFSFCLCSGQCLKFSFSSFYSDPSMMWVMEYDVIGLTAFFQPQEHLAAHWWNVIRLKWACHFRFIIHIYSHLFFILNFYSFWSVSFLTLLPFLSSFFILLQSINQLIDWLMDWLIDRLIEWLIGGLIDGLIDWLIDWWLIDWLIDWWIVWLIDWLIHRLMDGWMDGLIDWLIDWLVDRLIDWFPFSCPCSIILFMHFFLALSNLLFKGMSEIYRKRSGPDCSSWRTRRRPAWKTRSSEVEHPWNAYPAQKSGPWSSGCSDWTSTCRRLSSIKIAIRNNLQSFHSCFTHPPWRTRYSLWVETGAFPWRVGGGKFCLRFSIRCAFCPYGLPLFQLRNLYSLFLSLHFFTFVSPVCSEFVSPPPGTSLLRGLVDDPWYSCTAGEKFISKQLFLPNHILFHSNWCSLIQVALFNVFKRRTLEVSKSENYSVVCGSSSSTSNSTFPGLGFEPQSWPFHVSRCGVRTPVMAIPRFQVWGSDPSQGNFSWCDSNDNSY